MLRAGRIANAMRRKLREFRIVRGVNAAVRDQKHAALARGVGEPSDIVQQFFRAGDVELAAWRHEIFLRVHLPENYFLRDHRASCGCAIEAPNPLRSVLLIEIAKTSSVAPFATVGEDRDPPAFANASSEPDHFPLPAD